jgi:hypothetical protein
VAALEGEGVQHEAGQARRKDGVSRRHAVDRVEQIGPRDVLRDVASRSGSDDADDVLGGVGDREREESNLGRAGSDGPQDGEAPAVGHVDVEQDDLGPSLKDDLDRGLDLVRLADDVERGRELAADTGANEFVVVDQEDARLHLGRSRQGQLHLSALTERAL